MSTTITRDEWLSALHDIGVGVDTSDDQAAVTVTEFCGMVGLRRAAATARLEALVTAGRAVRTLKRLHRQDGRSFRCTAYRLIDQPKAKRK